MGPTKKSYCTVIYEKLKSWFTGPYIWQGLRIIWRTVVGHFDLPIRSANTIENHENLWRSPYGVAFFLKRNIHTCTTNVAARRQLSLEKSAFIEFFCLYAIILRHAGSIWFCQSCIIFKATPKSSAPTAWNRNSFFELPNFLRFLQNSLNSRSQPN